VTAATAQAALFRALADHLDHHPHLPTLWIGVGMQIHTGGDTDGSRARGLIAWARSLDHPAIELEPVGVESIAPTKVRGRIATRLPSGHGLDIWCEIPEVLHDPDRTVITVDELETLLDEHDELQQLLETPATSPDTATAPAPREDPS
jgi:hypothetical protein